MEEIAKEPNLEEEDKKLKEELIEKTKNIKIDEEEVNNILLIGSTGNGKSSLGNVLVGQEGYFKESELAASETKDYKIGKLEVDLGEGRKIEYRIIDTIGIGDTTLTPAAVLYKLGMVAQELRGGLKQVFFVTRGRFNQQESEAFNVIKKCSF